MKVRTRLFQLFVVIVPLSLAGCLSMILPKPAEPASKPEPPANPANLDKYFQPKQGNHPAEVEMTDIGSWEFMNWQPGQFSVLGTYVDGVQKAVNRTFLVSRDGDVWVIEATHIDDRGQKTVTQTAASGFQPGTKAKPNVKWIKTQDKDGKVTKLDNAIGLAIANAALGAGSGPTMTTETTYEDGGDITVPAGTFQGTALTKEKGTSAWMHPGLPISPIVKATSSDGKTVTVLLDFGNNGKSDLNE